MLLVGEWVFGSNLGEFLLSSKTFDLLYLCPLKHKRRTLVLSCLGNMLHIPWKRCMKQCPVFPCNEKGRAEDLHTPRIGRAPLLSRGASSVCLFFCFTCPWEGQKMGHSQLGLNQHSQDWGYSSSSTINPPGL